MTKAGPCIGAVIELQTDRHDRQTDRQIFGVTKTWVYALMYVTKLGLYVRAVTKLQTNG